jgi:hypothetical protein
LSCIQVQFFVCVIKTPLELELLIRRPSNKTTITRACFEQFSLICWWVATQAQYGCSYLPTVGAHSLIAYEHTHKNSHHMLEEFHFKAVWSGGPENPRARVLSSSG